MAGAAAANGTMNGALADNARGLSRTGSAGGDVTAACRGNWSGSARMARCPADDIPVSTAPPTEAGSAVAMGARAPAGGWEGGAGFAIQPRRRWSPLSRRPSQRRRAGHR